MDKKPLLERLVDFDNYGYKAMERYTLRMEAHQEIKRLQGLLSFGTDTDEYRRLRAENDRLKLEVHKWQQESSSLSRKLGTALMDLVKIREAANEVIRSTDFDHLPPTLSSLRSLSDALKGDENGTKT